MNSITKALIFIGCVSAGCAENEVEALASHSNAVIVKERATGEHKGNKDLLVKADYDGDKIQDTAYFTYNDGVYNLTVELGSGENVELIEISSITNIGIKEKAPGEYPMACSKGYGDSCTLGEENIKLDYVGLELFQYESSSRVYYWDGTNFSVAYLVD